MSITDEIEDRVATGDLFPLELETASQIRWMFMVRELRDAIINPPDGEEERFDDLHADLTSFLYWRRIDQEYLWLLSPKSRGVWEIKSRREEPQIRVFGQFAQKDVFLATRFRYRSEMGNFDNPNWLYEIKQVERQWNSLFLGQFTPLKTSNQYKLFTGASDGKYFKD
jgi:hypothetical protein